MAVYSHRKGQDRYTDVAAPGDILYSGNVCTVQQHFFQIILVCADSSDSLKLAVWDAVFASLGFSRIIHMVTMGVSGLCVHGADIASL